LTHSGGRELMLNSSFTMKWYVEITSNIMSVCVCVSMKDMVVMGNMIVTMQVKT